MTESEKPASGGMTVRGAASLGIGAMVGAGIFALLGEAGAVAGAATWLSFLLGGVIATLLGYVVAKLGARYPSSGGLVTFLTQGFGVGHLVGTFAWLLYFAAIIITAMVAVSFGSYAVALFIGEGASATAANLFTAGVIVIVAAVQILGADAISKIQSLVVVILMAVFAVFIAVTLGQMDAALLSTSLYPPAFDIVSSIALTFFAYLGFAVISYAGEDLPDPARNLPKATYIALGITTALYILISLGVFGTLTVDQVIGYGETALAEAARPVLGDAGFAMMAVAALLATFTSVNANVYGVVGLTSALARSGQFPPKFAHPGRFGSTMGMGVSSILVLLLALLVDLTAIASLGSVVALVIFLMVALAGMRLRAETGSNIVIIVLGILSTAVVLLVFGIQTWQTAPETFVAMIVVLGLAVVLELVWSAVFRSRQGTPATE
jgi:amino acid transporter